MLVGQCVRSTPLLTYTLPATSIVSEVASDSLFHVTMTVTNNDVYCAPTWYNVTLRPVGVASAVGTDTSRLNFGCNVVRVVIKPDANAKDISFSITNAAQSFLLVGNASGGNYTYCGVVGDGTWSHGPCE